MKTQRQYFGTDGIRGRVGHSLVNPEFVLKLGWAVGCVLANGGGSKVLIGKDTRISGYMLESALEAGLSAAGVDIHLLGPMPTPAIAYLTRTLRAKAGIVISASHNPYYDNGIKFFSADGSKLADDIELAIEQQLQRPIMTVESAKLGKAYRINDAPGRYIEFCKSTVASSVNFKGMKIVVDCAHGATYHIAPHVFSELGAEVLELGVDPDGFNINSSCGSTRPEVLQQIVVSEEADVGIALDGDGDRLIMVDRMGNVVDGDELLYIIAKQQHSLGELAGGVVGTIMSNLGLEIALQKLNIPFSRSKVGDRYVMEELLKSGWSLGGEASGHIICLRKTTTGDGIISALQVLAAMCQTGLGLHELKADLVKYPQTIVNVSMQQRIDIDNDTRFTKLLTEAQAQLHGYGRILLRPSGTEPLMRIMVEGEEAVQVETIAKLLAVQVEEIIKQHANT
ncbi:MAG: glmM [Gammaproteobacteria bacterium]|nr:glmM [Gammaproteobacteria bacterium]